MRWVTHKKGGFVFHVGGPIVLLLLLVLFVIISLTNPALADKITGSLAAISQAVKGAVT